MVIQIFSICKVIWVFLKIMQSFFIGGGSNPQSIIAGFDHEVLANAFNVSTSQLYYDQFLNFKLLHIIYHRIIMSKNPFKLIYEIHKYVTPTL